MVYFIYYLEFAGINVSLNHIVEIYSSSKFQSELKKDLSGPCSQILKAEFLVNLRHTTDMQRQKSEVISFTVDHANK